MPGATPRYGIRYPLLGEVVDAAGIAATMTDIDAVLAATQANVDGYLQRAGVRGRAAAANQAVVIATDTAVNFEAVDDPLGMWNAGTPNRFTIQQSGLYYVITSPFNIDNGGATITSTRWWITLNGVPCYAKTKPRALDWSSSGASLTTLSGLLACGVGDIVQVFFRWTGAGGPTTDIHLSEIGVYRVGALP